MNTHYIGVGDTLTPLRVTLKQRNNAGALEAVDLTSLTCKFKMVANSDDSVKTAETASNVSVTNARNGIVQYDFQSADVDTSGTFWAWFMTYSGSEKDTYPANGRQLKVIISSAG